MRFDTFGRDHHHLAGIDFAHEFCPDDVERAGLGRQRPAVADPAQHQRAYAQRIAYADQLGARHGHDRKRAFHPAQGVLHPFRDIALKRARHEVDDTFAVRRALEDAAVFDQLPAQRICIGDIAIVGDGGTPHGEFTEKRLHIADRGLSLRAACGIADMADGKLPREGFHDRLGGEVVADIAESARGLKARFRIVADDTARFLPAMLKRMQPQRHEVGRVSHPDDAKDTAFFLGFVVILQIPQVGGVERMGGGHDLGQSGAPAPDRLCALLRGSRWSCHPAAMLRRSVIFHRSVTGCDHWGLSLHNGSCRIRPRRRPRVSRNGW